MKKIFTIIFISFFMIVSLSAETYNTIKGFDSEGYTRNDSNNFGVNKKWKIKNINKNNLLSTPYVDSSLKVYDFADILTSDEESEIITNIKNYINKTNMDMVIVTIDMPYSSDNENETYAADFYDYNDFGIDYENYSGVLLLRNVYSEDPYFNVYTFGEAQLYYSYDNCENMLDDIYPYLRNKDYLTGFNLFISDFSKYYDSGYKTTAYYLDENGILVKKYKPPYLGANIIAIITTIVSMIVMINKNVMVKAAINANEYLDKRSINYSNKKDNLIKSFTTHHYVSSSSGGSGHSSGGSFHSSIGSSGGGHSFGGGRHG